MKLAVNGDLVFGMASTLPPSAFVGELGDEASEAAAPIVRSLRGPENEPKIGPKVTVDGRRAATHRDQAVEFGPLGSTALPMAWLGNISIGNRHVLVHEGLFQCAPTGSVKSIALAQRIASAKGVVVQADPMDDDATAATSGDGAGPVSRSDYGDPTALQTMLSRVSSARLADLLPPQYAFLVGDPVDVSTGAVVTDSIDIQRAAPTFAFRRHYASNRSHKESPFGFGWTHNFDAALWLEVGRVVVRARDGRELEFDCVPLPDAVARAGDELLDPTGVLRLRCHGRHHWELITPQETLHFGPIPGTASADTDRGFAKLRKVVVPGQPLTELAYDAHARLHRIQVDGQTMVELAYDQADRIRSLNRDAALFAYSASGDLAVATDADGNQRTYEYAGHLLVAETNRRGGVFYYGYDGHGATARCIRTWGTHGRLHRILAYDSDQTSVIDSLGHRTTYECGPLGLVRGRRDARGNTTGFAYDDQLRLTKIDRAGGTSDVDTYDDQGRLIKQRQASGAVWQMGYDPAGRLVSGTDPVGGKWTFDYDMRGNLTRCTDPDGHVTRMEYEAGQLNRIIDPLGRATQLQVGRGAEVTEVTSADGERHTFEYDAQGRLSRSEDPRGNEARWSYDRCGRCIAHARGADTIRFHRDAEGSVVGIEDPHSHWVVRRDCFGTVVAMSDGEAELSYTHDTEGRLCSASCNDGARWECRRDERGNVVAAVAQGRFECRITRSLETARAEQLAWENSTVAIAWDVAGRIASAFDGTTTRKFDYRDDGLLAGYDTPRDATTVRRNARGVVLHQTHSGREVVTDHVDHAGNRYGLSLADGPSLSYLWTDAAGLDRIAVMGAQTFDLSVERVDGQTVVAHDGQRATLRAGNGTAPPVTDASATDAPATNAPATNAATTDAPATDALFRPLAGLGGQTWLWDEDRLLLDGDVIRICDPRTGQHLASVHADGLKLAGQDPSEPQSNPAPHAQDLIRDAQVHAALFPALPALQAQTPLAILRASFAPRVWDPTVRPVDGAHPWDPDAWLVAPPEPADAPDETRLDPQTLLRLLSPFPRPPLRPQ